MKIATFNVNNINRRLPNLLQWLKSARPDIACLQELKSTDANFPIHAIEKAGYRAVWQGEKTWDGVAILSRDGEPIVTINSLNNQNSGGLQVTAPIRIDVSSMARGKWQATFNGETLCTTAAPMVKAARILIAKSYDPSCISMGFGKCIDMIVPLLVVRRRYCQ
jgi:exonuclease III